MSLIIKAIAMGLTIRFQVALVIKTLEEESWCLVSIINLDNEVDWYYINKFKTSWDMIDIIITLLMSLPLIVLGSTIGPDSALSVDFPNQLKAAYRRPVKGK